jgi:hypothetical protein
MWSVVLNYPALVGRSVGQHICRPSVTRSRSVYLVSTRGCLLRRYRCKRACSRTLQFRCATYRASTQSTTVYRTLTRDESIYLTGYPVRHLSQTTMPIERTSLSLCTVFSRFDVLFIEMLHLCKFQPIYHFRFFDLIKILHFVDCKSFIISSRMCPSSPRVVYRSHSTNEFVFCVTVCMHTNIKNISYRG